MSSYGFNPGKVDIAQKGVQSGYNLIMTELNTNFQSKFIDTMATAWACPIAQTYFTNTVMPAINEIIDVTTKNFSTFQQTIKSAGESWATAQEYTYSGVTLETQSSTISVEGIKDILNGIVGIVDDGVITTAVSALPTIQATIEGYLEQVKGIISNNEAFLGGDQQAQLYSLVEKVANVTKDGFSEMQSSVSKAIDQTKTDYATKSSNIANSFTAS